MKIRRFEIKEAKAASNLIQQTLKQSNSRDYNKDIINNLCELYSPSGMEELSRERQLYVAISGKRIVGIGGIFKDTISCLFVDPNSQEKGIGTGIMEVLEEKAREAGFKMTRLFSSLTALTFYEKMGYQKSGVNKDERYGITWEMKKRIIQGD